MLQAFTKRHVQAALMLDRDSHADGFLSREETAI
jgi:hypothetical protein